MRKAYILLPPLYVCFSPFIASGVNFSFFARLRFPIYRYLRFHSRDIEIRSFPSLGLGMYLFRLLYWRII